jgi:hypothetical protein
MFIKDISALRGKSGFVSYKTDRLVLISISLVIREINKPSKIRLIDKSGEIFQLVCLLNKKPSV